MVARLTAKSDFEAFWKDKAVKRSHPLHWRNLSGALFCKKSTCSGGAWKDMASKLCHSGQWGDLYSPMQEGMVTKTLWHLWIRTAQMMLRRSPVERHQEQRCHCSIPTQRANQQQMLHALNLSP